MLKFVKVTTDTGPKNIPTIDYLQFQHPVFSSFFVILLIKLGNKVPKLFANYESATECNVLSNTEIIKLYPF